jgi:hypothetical protein
MQCPVSTTVGTGKNGELFFAGVGLNCKLMRREERHETRQTGKRSVLRHIIWMHRYTFWDFTGWPMAHLVMGMVL